MTQGKLKKILDTFGSNCLIIFDGFDEHICGTNRDVVSIIRKKKYLSCNIIIISRPHAARVQGFNYINAKQFASKILKNEQKIEAVLHFNPAEVNSDHPIHRCPILLTFLCLLAKEDEIDLTDKAIHTGEIYLRMIRCLYKKFTIRKEVIYEHGNFIKVMKNIGKLALRTLLSRNSLLRKNEVLKEASSDAFDYGLLIGHEEGFCLIGDETADIYVRLHSLIVVFRNSLVSSILYGRFTNRLKLGTC